MGGKRKIPGSLRDAPAASIQKWLEHADDENANCETTNSLDKNSLCTLACFMLGWQPDAPLPGCHSLIWSCSPKKENGIMQRLTETNLGWAAERQYSQRGRPLAKTCWGIQEVTRFMQSHVKGKSADDDLGAHGCMFADGSPQNPSPMPQFILIKEKWGPEQVEKYERVKVEQSQARLHIALVFLLDLTMFEERTLRLNLVERGFPARSQESPKPLKVPVFQDPTISMEDLEGVEFPQNGYTCEQEQDKFLIQHADLPGLTVQPFGFNWMCTVQNKALIITFSHPISAAKDLFVYRFSGLLKSCLYLEESKVVYT
ncbi:unnamed protein product [Durusdinium trenchii]|uniref:Uncharacterized protein n=1 Tax=Durusdinium trenchii TaxID=1381693 RepID=A0ABP0JWT0_9DINO